MQGGGRAKWTPYPPPVNYFGVRSEDSVPGCGFRGGFVEFGSAQEKSGDSPLLFIVHD